MREFWNTIQLIFTAVGGWLGWFLGGCDGLLYALIVFVVIDYVTGVMAAVVDHKLSSEVGFKGIFKKVLIFLLVGIGHILDTHVIGSGTDTGSKTASQLFARSRQHRSGRSTRDTLAAFP